MKNYYKILGVKKDASEEEIREHWVEWMRKLHPDQRIDGGGEEKRIKEINEAYQVLKHSSTRGEYDLKRAYDQRKRGYYFQKLSVPIGIVIILIALATVYLKRPNITIEQALIAQDQINKTDQPNQKDQTDQINQIDQTNQNSVISNQGAVISYQTNQTNERNEIDHRNQKDQRSVTSDQRAVISDQINQRNQKDPPQKRIKPSPQRRNDATMPKPDEASKPATQLPNDSITQLTSDPTPQRLNVLTAPINEKNQTNQINQTDQINQINPINPIVASTNQPKPSNVTNVLNDPNDRSVLNVPLIATEEEVRRFFADYTEQYTQKDLDSFISLFSSRAIQNRQDGLEGIRKIYGNFLKQSQEIKYDIDHIKIEIYQNGVEVKARYELVQMVKKSGDKKVWRGDIRWSLVKEDGALKILSLDYQHQKSP